MSNYGIQTAARYTMPYTKHYYLGNVVPLTPKAQMRLKWMDYIYSGKSVPECARHFEHPYRTVKYWYDRYDPRDLTSLGDKSRRPKRVRRREISSTVYMG